MTLKVFFRFYEELNEYLPPPRRKHTFELFLETPCSVGEAVDALGVPRSEIDLVLANGDPVGFSTALSEDDRISVYPEFESLDISSLGRLRPRPLRRTRFLVDPSLDRPHRLVITLRLLGFDTAYRAAEGRDPPTGEVEGPTRILVRRQGLLPGEEEPSHRLLLQSSDPDRQLVEIIRRLDLLAAITPFSRCLRCNGRLERSTEGQRERSWRCRSCGGLVREGPGCRRILQLVGDFKERDRPARATPDPHSR